MAASQGRHTYSRIYKQSLHEFNKDIKNMKKTTPTILDKKSTEHSHHISGTPTIAELKRRVMMRRAEKNQYKTETKSKRRNK